jgi:hypothetical protein
MGRWFRIEFEIRWKQKNDMKKNDWIDLEGKSRAKWGVGFFKIFLNPGVEKDSGDLAHERIREHFITGCLILSVNYSIYVFLYGNYSKSCYTSRVVMHNRPRW